MTVELSEYGERKKLAEKHAMELLAALQWYVANDDTYEGEDPLPDHHGATWDEINAPWLEGKRRAIAAIQAATGEPQ